MDWQAIGLSVRLAAATTVILLAIGLALAYWLTFSRRRWKFLVEAVVALPLVLPPTVLGFYVLLAIGPHSPIGALYARVGGGTLPFSFQGLLIASVLYSLPFMVHPIQSGLRSLSPSLREASFTLGKSKWTTLVKILLPNIRASVITGFVLTFAHTIGEFGVVLMVGGNIAGKTRLISIAMYDEVQSMNYHTANIYAGILFAFSFLILFVVYLVNNRSGEISPLA